MSPSQLERLVWSPQAADSSRCLPGLFVVPPDTEPGEADPERDARQPRREQEPGPSVSGRFWVTLIGLDPGQRRFTYCGIESPTWSVAALEVWHRNGRWEVDVLFLKEIIRWWRRRRGARG